MRLISRLECLRDQLSGIDLAEVLRPSDAEFCEKFEVQEEELEKRMPHEQKEERDILWRYVANI